MSLVLLQYTLSNAAITFYAGRNDRSSPVVARRHERFTRGDFTRARQGMLRVTGRTMTNVRVEIARFCNVTNDDMRGTCDIEQSDHMNCIIYPNFTFSLGKYVN